MSTQSGNIEQAWESMPRMGERVIAFSHCTHQAHKALASNFPYPCNEPNFMYWVGHWEYATGKPIDEHTHVTHWMYPPSLPAEFGSVGNVRWMESGNPRTYTIYAVTKEGMHEIEVDAPQGYEMKYKAHIMDDSWKVDMRPKPTWFDKVLKWVGLRRL